MPEPKPPAGTEEVEAAWAEAAERNAKIDQLGEKARELEGMGLTAGARKARQAAERLGRGGRRG